MEIDIRAPGEEAPREPPAVQWTTDALWRYWTWELRFPEHCFTNKYGAAITSALRPYVRSGHRVLDYGCGMGFLSARIARSIGADVWSADSHPGAVQAARERNEGLAHFRGAALIDDLPPGIRFDRVIAVEVLEHLDDAQTDGFFGTVKAVLRPDGLLIVTTPNAEHLDRKQILCPNCSHVFHRWQHVRSIDRQLLDALGRDHGFRLVRATETDFSRRRPWPPGLRRMVARWTHRGSAPHLLGVYANESGDFA